MTARLWLGLPDFAARRTGFQVRAADAIPGERGHRAGGAGLLPLSLAAPAGGGEKRERACGPVGRMEGERRAFPPNGGKCGRGLLDARCRQEPAALCEPGVREDMGTQRRPVWTNAETCWRRCIPRIGSVPGHSWRRNKVQACEETYRIVRPDGAVRWIHDRSFPIFNQDGKALPGNGDCGGYYRAAGTGRAAPPGAKNGRGGKVGRRCRA